jgi:hypothetical protein
MQQQVEALLTQQQQQHQMQIAQLQASQPLKASQPFQKASKALAASTPIKAKMVSNANIGTSMTGPLIVVVLALLFASRRK